MTSQTPAPKASSAAALLASLPTNPPKLAQPADPDFLSVILQALTPKTKGSDEGSTKEEAAEKEKADAANSTNTKAGTDPADSTGLMLTLLAMSAPSLPPLPKLPKAAPHRTAPEPVKEASADAPGANTKSGAAQASPKGVPLSKMLASPESSPKTAVPPEIANGTSAAISGQRMNIAAQKNEVAGEGEQKLPPAAASSLAAVTGVESATAPGQDSARKPLDFSWREATPEVVAMVNLAGKPAETAVSEAATLPAAATPAERVEQMISQEVITMRQTGAQTLGVSLKVDENTQLFLQLTTQNGQIQASLSCEKGNFSALDSQWSQLQASLARQNVQLMPASGASQFNFQQPSQQQQRQLPQQWEEWQQANLGVPPAQSRQQKNPNARRPRIDWETWA